MPRIRVTMKEMEEILKWPDIREDIFSAWNHILEHGFLFDYFTLVIDTDDYVYEKHLGIQGRITKHTYKVKIIGVGKEQKIQVKIIWRASDNLMRNKTIEITVLEWLDGINKTVRDCSSKNWQEWDVMKADVEVLCPMMFMQYALLKSMNREVIEMPVTQKRYKPMSERKPSKPKEEYKLFEVIRKYSKHINHNKHHFTCEAWQVKGHFRTYKSGKKVWIKPFQKGKGKIKEKEYKL